MGRWDFRPGAVAPAAALLACLGAAARTDAQVNATTPGALTAYSTLVAAGFEWRISGDDNFNCAVSLEYRTAGESAWRPAQPLMRVARDLWTHGESPGNLLAGSLFHLEPETDYEARLTLADPNGGAEQRVVAFRTRAGYRSARLRTLHVVPGSGGGDGSEGNPFRGLAAADSAAQPGDLFLVGPGTYAGRFLVTRSGTDSLPITYRGSDPALVILDGGGGTTDSSHCVVVRGRRRVYLENLGFVNALRPVCADSAVGVAIRGCVVRPINQLLYTQGIRAAFARDLLIANNVVEMPGQWATIGRTGTYGIGGYGILLEGTGHIVCFNRVVEAWDAISVPVGGSAIPDDITSNLDVYGNDVDRASDDAVQADVTHHNVRIFANRLLNSGSTVSFQPGFGGPGYVLYNEMYNARIEPYKFHQELVFGWAQETSGFRVYHNTSISNRNGWYEAGIWHNGRLRNNLILGARAGQATLVMGYTYLGADLNYDGYNRVGGNPTLVQYSGSNYASLPAFYAGRGHEQFGVELGYSAFVNAPVPHHPEWNWQNGYGAAYVPGDYDLRLAAGSAAIDRGQVLANINDGYSGAAPDLGCYEKDQPIPPYGPRPASQPLRALAGRDLPAGEAPLTVQFTGASQNARGPGTTYRWDFGDGSPPTDDPNPTHTFVTPNRYDPRLTVTDADGTVADTTVMVLVLESATGVPEASRRLAAPRVTPNPASGPATIRFAVPEPARAWLALYDVRGTRLRTLREGWFGAGTYEVEWDGRDSRGRPMRPGVYFLRLVAGDRESVRRLVVVDRR